MLKIVFFSVLILSVLGWWESAWLLGSMMSVLCFMMWSSVGGQELFSENLFNDSFSLMLVFLSSMVVSMGILSSNKVYLGGQEFNSFLISLVMGAIFLILCFFSSSIFWFYWWFECSLVPLFYLILKWGYQPERIQASKMLFLYTLFGSLPFLLLLGLMFSFQSVSFFMWGWFFKNVDEFIVWFVLVMPFLVKMPLYGVHSWLPKAHVEAPVAGSMILAGLTLKLGGYGMIRVMELWGGMNEIFFILMFLWGGMVTSFLCLRQIDVKSLIALSSVSHMAFVSAGLLSYSWFGWFGGMILMISHGFCSSMMFLGVGLMFNSQNTRSFMILKGFMGLSPFFSFWISISLLLNLGAPFTLNLVGEVFLIISMVSYEMFLMFFVLIVSLLTIGYSLMVFGGSIHGSFSSFIKVWSKTVFLENFVFFYFLLFTFLFILNVEMIFF